MRGKLVAQFGDDFPIHYIGRPESASPAEGSADLHARAQNAIIRAAFAEGLPEDVALPKELASRQNGDKNGHKVPRQAAKKKNVAATTAN
jgi:hypothetical protein